MKLEGPVGLLDESVNFKGHKGGVAIRHELALVDRLFRVEFELGEPLAGEPYDEITDTSWTVIDLGRRGGEEAAPAKSPLGYVIRPSQRQVEKPGKPGGTVFVAVQNLADEDFPRRLHDSQLEVLFGAEMGEESAFA